MEHLIDNATMRVVASSSDEALILDHAACLPQFADYTVVGHSTHHLVAYTINQLRSLYVNTGGRMGPGTYQRHELERLIVSQLAGRPETVDAPPARKKRHPIIPPGRYPNGDTVEDRRNEMAAAKKTTSKKAPAKKAAPKKTAAKKAAPARTKQNGVLEPKAGTVTATIFSIADRISKKNKAPAPRADVLAECEKKGVKPGSATSGYQLWRRYHGLVK